MTLTLAAVVWNDAHGSSDSFEPHEVAHQPYRFTSVGFLIRSDEIGVSLAGEVGEDGRYRDHVFVPRAMIVKEWVIGPLRKPRRRKEPPCPEPSSPPS